MKSLRLVPGLTDRLLDAVIQKLPNLPNRHQSELKAITKPVFSGGLRTGGGRTRDCLTTHRGTTQALGQGARGGRTSQGGARTPPRTGGQQRGRGSRGPPQTPTDFGGNPGGNRTRARDGGREAREAQESRESRARDQNSPHVRILAATEWRQLSELLRPLTRPASSTAQAGQNVRDVEGNTAAQSAVLAGVDGGGAELREGEGPGTQGSLLGEHEVLLALWRVACGLMQTAAAPATPRPPPSLPSPPPRSSSPSSTPLQPEAPRDSNPWDPFQSASSSSLPTLGAGGAFPSLDSSSHLFFRAAGAAAAGGFPGPGPRAAGLGLGPPAATAAMASGSTDDAPGPLLGSPVARRRGVEAAAAALRARCPRMSAGGLVEALRLLAALAQHTQPDDVRLGSGSEAFGSRSGAGPSSAAGRLLDLVGPFLEGVLGAAGADPQVLLGLVPYLPPLHRTLLPHRTAAVAAASPSAAAPLTHPVLEAALGGLMGGSLLVMPSLQELCVCTAAATACDYVPPRSWLELLEGELQNQIFLVTPSQGAVVLASLEHLTGLRSSTPTAVPQLPPPPLLSAGCVDMLWDEVCGQAGAADAGSCAEWLRELAWFCDSGLLPPSSSPQARAGVGTGGGNHGSPGVGRIRDVVALLASRVAPQLASHSVQQLAGVLTAAARLAEYEDTAGPIANMGEQNTAGGSGRSRGPTVGTAGAATWRRAFLDTAAAAVLRVMDLDTAGCTLPQLSACILALVPLASAVTIEAKAGQAKPAGAGRRQDAAAVAPTDVGQPPLLAALLGPLLEVAPGTLVRCMLPPAVTSNLAENTTAMAAAIDLGPSDLVWLPRAEAALVALREAASGFPSSAPQPFAVTQEAPIPSLIPQLDGQGDAPSGLASRVVAALLASLGRLGPEQLLQLAASSSHPWTAGLFDSAFRRDLIRALLATPVPDRGVPRTASTTSNSNQRWAGRAPPSAATAATLAGAVRGLDPGSVVAVLGAAAERLGRGRATAGWVPSAVLAAGAAWLLELEDPDREPGFMEGGVAMGGVTGAGGGSPVGLSPGAETGQVYQEGSGQGRLLSAAEWCEALRALASSLAAMGPAEAAAAGFMPPASLRLLVRVLAPVWPSLDPDETAEVISAVATLYDAVQSAADVTGVAGSGSGAGQEQPPQQQQQEQGWGADAEGSVADWQLLQRAAAASMARMSPRGLVLAVSAAAPLAPAAPLCDEWIQVLNGALQLPPPAPSLLLRYPEELPPCGVLEALAASEVLRLLLACTDLAAATIAAGSPEQAARLPVLPLLQRLGTQLLASQQRRHSTPGAADATTQLPPTSTGNAVLQPPPAPPAAPVPCADVCRVLLRLAALATDPVSAAVLGTSATPLLSYLQLRAFRGARLADLQAGLQGVSGLLLSPNAAWAASLCAATLPALRNRPLSDLAALSGRMAQAWVVPTEEWHSALLEVSLERMGRTSSRPVGDGSRSGGSGGEGPTLGSSDLRALELLLWANALWTRLSPGHASESGNGGSWDVGVLRLPAEWLDAVAESCAPALPAGQPRLLAGLAFSFGVLAHDPGPAFMAALLEGCSSSLPSFTGPQLARLAYGVAATGHRPADPWVVRLQLQAAKKLQECDPAELMDLLEGLLALSEGAAYSFRRDGVAVVAGGVHGNGTDRTGSQRDRARWETYGGASYPSAPSAMAPGGSGRPGGAARLQRAFLEAFWAASGAVLERDGRLAMEAVVRRARRDDLQLLERVKDDFRQRTADPQVGPAWRYWTEQVPSLDPSLAAPDATVQRQLAQLATPLFDGAGEGDPPGLGVSRLQRFMAWSVLRRSELPPPLPEGLAPWCGHVALRCGELLMGRRPLPGADKEHGGLEQVALRSLQGKYQRGDSDPWVVSAGKEEERDAGPDGKDMSGELERQGPSASSEQPLEQQQQHYYHRQQGGQGEVGREREWQHAGIPVLLAPPDWWLAALLRCQTGVLLAGAGAVIRQEQVLEMGRAALAWGVTPPLEWGEAYLRASRQTLFPGSGMPELTTEVVRGVTREGTAQGSGAVSGSIEGQGGQCQEEGQLIGEHQSGDPQTGWELDALLRLLSTVLSLDLAPGSGWLSAAEQASVPLLQNCHPEDAIALCLALDRLEHRPGRRWASALLAATAPAALATAAPSPLSVAALLAALADMRVRPPDSWVEGALAALHGRHAELPALLRAQLLSAVASLEVRPTPTWLAPQLEAYWSDLPELLLDPLSDASALVSGLAALSALDVPVKQPQLAMLLGLMSQRLAGVANGPGAGGNSAGSHVGVSAAANMARVLICLGEMRRAAPNRANRQLLDTLFAAVAERLPLAGPLTPRLLDSWDKLVPV